MFPVAKLKEKNLVFGSSKETGLALDSGVFYLEYPSKFSPINSWKFCKEFIIINKGFLV